MVELTMTQAVNAQAAAEKNQQDFTTDMSVGEILSRSRMHYKLSLQDIERELHIKPPQIMAMESDRFDSLPGRVYAIGFIRSYSEHLGLDGSKMVKLYKHQIRGRASQTVSNTAVCHSESKTPSIWLVILTLIVLLSVALFWAAASSEKSYELSDIPDVPADLKQSAGGTSFLQTPTSQIGESDAQGPAQDVLDLPSQAIIAQPTTPQGIVLKVTDKSWVEIKSTDGKTLVSKTLNPGEQYFIPKRDGLSLDLDNAAGIRLEIDDQDLGDLGVSGEALRDFSLDFDYLKAQLNQTSEIEPQ